MFMLHKGLAKLGPRRMPKILMVLSHFQANFLEIESLDLSLVGWLVVILYSICTFTCTFTFTFTVLRFPATRGCYQIPSKVHSAEIQQKLEELKKAKRDHRKRRRSAVGNSSVWKILIVITINGSHIFTGSMKLGHSVSSPFFKGAGLSFWKI